MAQSLIIKDGSGAIKTLTVESSSYGFIPVHQITSSTAAPIYITASSTNPLPVTGNINVDVVVGDLITVTASAANPVYVTGTLTVNTASSAVTVSNFPSTYTVTASSASPVYVTGTLTVNTASSVAVTSLPNVSVSSLPNVILSTSFTDVSLSSVTSFAWNTSASGTFKILDNNSSRKSVTIFNPGPYNLYVVLAKDTANAGAKNGFTLVNTASAPSSYSFILYPSGTYISETPMVCPFYGGYFISGSASVGVYTTVIS